MTTTNYFDGISTLDELKKAYRKAAFENHPDKGGNAETMAAINNEYDKVFAELKANERNTEGRAEAEKAGEAWENISPDDITGDDGYKAIIELLLHIDQNITIELCGAWLWISGATREHKDELKAAGCWWACKKKMWYWRPSDAKVYHNRRNHSMDYIRAKYGSATVRKEEEKRRLSA